MCQIVVVEERERVGSDRVMGSSSSDEFEGYFRRADLDGDGQISGAEAVAFFQASSLSKHVLAQVWTYADQRKAGYLGRQEFYNALKLVTVAQSQQELTPDIVKAALYSPASSRIPPPKINLSAIPSPHLVSIPSATATLPAPHTSTFRPPQAPPPTTTNQIAIPATFSNQAFPNQSGPRGPPAGAVPNSGPSTGWVNIRPASQTQSRGTTQDGFRLKAPGLTPAVQYRPPVISGPLPSASHGLQDSSSLASNQQAPKDPKPAAAASANGFAADALFGDVFTAVSIQPQQTSSTSVPSSAVVPVGPLPSPGTTSVGSLQGTFPQQRASAGSQPAPGPSSAGTIQGTFPQQHAPAHSLGTQNHQIAAQNFPSLPSAGYAAGSRSIAPDQSQHPWPKMTPSDIQKYTKVFVQVDTDRDGKITGEQARNLFLSWRLPREVLKQVWDLSDQDNDSMLSLREFCIALYLMERFREGRTLPSALPTSISADETQLSATSHHSASFGGRSVGPAPVGIRHPQVMTGARLPPAPVPKPPRPPSAHPSDDRQPSQQKPKIPVLEKHLVDQLSEEEQNFLNSKFHEASQAEKKVDELEKEISDSRQKIEFFRAKMQELILYKSRCDNRLNEVSARVSSDRLEVESLAKKYEEKCKQAGDVASRLTIEEATFRDIQEKKMELYRAIVKMEEGGTDAGVLKEYVDRIQSELEELVKSLNERCKQYGLHARPTSLVELPFGWQPGIQGGAADWDEGWDMFEDEGFTFVKELTLDVQNVVAPPKTKSAKVKKDATSTDRDQNVSSPLAEMKSEKDPSLKMQDPDTDSARETGENGVVKNAPDSPSENSGTGSQQQEVQGSPFRDNAGDVLLQDKEIQSDMGSAESVKAGGKSIDGPLWGTFDTHFDESALRFDSFSGKDLDHEKHLFDIGEFGLNPIKTGSRMENMYQAKSPFMFVDSVPSTPAYDQGRGIFADSVPSTPAYDQGKNIFTDSVPSTPSYDQGKNFFADSVPSTPAYNQGKSIFADSVPSTPAYALGKSSHAFADSVPSTPAYNNSPRKSGEGSEGYSFDSFSRFDSFNMHDGGLFQSSNPSLSRFDSMRSTAESDQGYGFSSRFDSFRETADSDQSHGVSRSDSFRDNDHSQGFGRFDSFRELDHNSSFPSSFDSFGESRNSFVSANDSGLSGSSFARFDSVRSSPGDFDSSHDFPSFDGADPFGSSGPFKSSAGSETPRKSSDSWGF